MKTKYKINRNELILDIKFLYDMGFDKNNPEDIFKYVNRFLKNQKIKFYGNRIFLYVDGIFLGIIHTTYLYLKKLHLKNNYLELNSYNSYFENLDIMEFNVKKINA